VDGCTWSLQNSWHMEMQEYIAKQVDKLEPENSADFVLLANMYAAVAKRDLLRMLNGRQSKEVWRNSPSHLDWGHSASWCWHTPAPFWHCACHLRPCSLQNLATQHNTLPIEKLATMSQLKNSDHRIASLWKFWCI